MRFAVPSGDIATASVSTRGGSVVAEAIERLKSETKESTKKSGRGAGKTLERFASGPVAQRQTNICEIAKTFFIGLGRRKISPRNSGWGGGGQLNDAARTANRKLVD